jgi:hypothetical protein
VNTEIVSGGLNEGDKVAVPAPAAGAKTGKAPAASSPFPTSGGAGRRGYGR